MRCKAGRSSVLVLIASVGAGFVSLGAGPLAPLLTTLAGPLLGGSITDCTPLAPCPAPVPPAIDGTDPANALFVCSGAECTLGKFTKPVAEPTITYTDSTGTHTVMTQQKCVIDANLNYRCKPAAAAIVLLNNDKV